MMAIESLSLLVLGIDHEREDGHFGTHCSLHSIPQESRTEFPSPIGLIDSKTAKPGNGNG